MKVPDSAHGWRLESDEPREEVEEEVISGPWTPSPDDWKSEVIYFLMVDRFSDGKEHERDLYSRGAPGNVDWLKWDTSGRARYQGGTLEGIESKLPYLKELGVTTIWVSPVAKQRKRQNTYHGYSSQDFMDVEPRLTNMEPGKQPMEVMRSLVKAAHSLDMRILIDVVFNHSGCNWVYSSVVDNPKLAEYQPYRQRGFGGWLAEDETVVYELRKDARDDGVWPVELQRPEAYHRAGTGNLGEGEMDDPLAENKRSDFFELRSIDHRAADALNTMIRIFQYWVAVTDCDGFRLDTLKHMTIDTARSFCSEIKDFAANRLGKENFLVVGEIAGGSEFQQAGQQAIGDSLDATLDIGEARVLLTEAALGNQPAKEYFNLISGSVPMATYRSVGRYVTVLDDHDLVSCAEGAPRVRFAARTGVQERVLLALATQLFGPGIPCIYYGTEQCLTGPEPPTARKELEDWGIHDHFLRETMFGAMHPRQNGMEGADADPELPGFAAFGACGFHIFDQSFWLYRATQTMLKLRAEEPIFRLGSYLDGSWVSEPKNMVAFSRLYKTDEAFVALNFSLEEEPMARIYVNHDPNNSDVVVLFNSSETLSVLRDGKQYDGPCAAGSEIHLGTDDNAKAFLPLPVMSAGQIILFKISQKPLSGRVSTSTSNL